jgi:hypothetical protein
MTDPADPKATMSMDMGPAGSVDVIIVDGTAYVRQGYGSYQEAPGTDLSQVSSQFDQGANLERQRAAITRVGRVGTEQVAGVRTTHYVVTCDAATLNRLVAEAGTAEGEIAGDTARLDYWLDDELQVAKFLMTAKVKVGDQTGSTITEMVLTDYGKPVAITAP